MTPRREFSAATCAAAWERANGRCEGFIQVPAILSGQRLGIGQPIRTIRCNAPIDVGGFHYDHIDPDYFSKDNELENCQVLCTSCHKLKTKTDIRDIAKSKRIVAKRIKARKPRGRPIMGTKRSGWRKRMSGRVERW